MVWSQNATFGVVRRLLFLAKSLFYKASDSFRPARLGVGLGGDPGVEMGKAIGLDANGEQRACRRRALFSNFRDIAS